MKFLITFTHVDGAFEALDDAGRARVGGHVAGLVQGLAAEQQTGMVFLAPAAEARTVRQDAEGRQAVTEGPIHPGPEQAGGYYIVEAASMEEALDWARRGRFMTGSTEVRRILDAPGG
jgi:hypothetical protein